MKRKSINPSTSHFESFIVGNIKYVDKTSYIYKLVSEPKGLYFFSRPRRFGKSLTLSTLKYMFQNRRDLFKGLYLDTTDYEWGAYPVIHLNMSVISISSNEVLRAGLFRQINDQASELKIVLNESYESPGAAFKDLITKAHEQLGSVVILIDEYDYPMLECIGKPQETKEWVQEIIQEFYIQIKAADSLLRFVFITGVTRFPKLGIFSKMNNLKDITYHPDYATLCGYTQEELEANFTEELQEVAQKQDTALSYAAFLAKVKHFYNGFKFYHRASTVYNPVSIALFVDFKEFNLFWASTGSASFAPKLLATHQGALVDIFSKPIPASLLDSFDPTNIEPRALLLQSGYLTINDAVDMGGELAYSLRYPNFEVETAFLSNLLPALAGYANAVESSNLAYNLLMLIKERDIHGLIEGVRSFMAGLPYLVQGIKNEYHFSNILNTIFRLLSLRVDVEVMTSRGRIDTVIESKTDVFIFEYKINSTAQAAIDQIHKNGYPERYASSGLPIKLIGLNYSMQKHEIDDVIVLEYVNRS